MDTKEILRETIHEAQDMILAALIDYLRLTQPQVTPENQTWDAAVAMSALFADKIKASRK